jgi:hypothetical protein
MKLALVRTPLVASVTRKPCPAAGSGNASAFPRSTSLRVEGYPVVDVHSCGLGSQRTDSGENVNVALRPRSTAR